MFLVSLQNIIDTAKMSEHANGGLAVVAEGFDDAVVLNAVRAVGLERSHQLRIYTARSFLSIIIIEQKYGRHNRTYFRIYDLEAPTPSLSLGYG